MSLSFTRREFYDLVWSKPMIHLASELGVSDVALHKVCRKHHIPNPPLGWWAKKAAGKDVKQIPLPEFEGDRPDTITIRSAPAADWKTKAVEVAEEKVRSAPPSPDGQPKRGGVIVRNTMAALRRGKSNDQGLICVHEAGLISCSIAKQSIGRVADFLPKLEAAAEVLGFKLTHDDEPSRFSDGVQTVKFEISEGYTREKHELTRSEKAERAAWEKRHERRGWRYEFGDPDVTPDFPPSVIRVRPDRRTDDEAYKVHGRADHCGAEGGRGGSQDRRPGPAARCVGSDDLQLERMKSSGFASRVVEGSELCEVILIARRKAPRARVRKLQTTSKNGAIDSYSTKSCRMTNTAKATTTSPRSHSHGSASAFFHRYCIRRFSEMARSISRRPSQSGLSL